MSLAIALDQIQRPTWWHENDRLTKPQERRLSAKTAETRNGILYYLQQRRGKKLSATELQAHFQLTNAQFWHIVTPLVESGKVKKHKPRHDRSLLEAA